MRAYGIQTEHGFGIAYSPSEYGESQKTVGEKEHTYTDVWLHSYSKEAIADLKDLWNWVVRNLKWLIAGIIGVLLLIAMVPLLLSGRGGK